MEVECAGVLEILFLVNMEFQLNLILRNAFDVQSSILDKIEEFKMIYFKTRVNSRHNRKLECAYSFPKIIIF